MPIIYGNDVEGQDRAPGVTRWMRVTKDCGAQELILGELDFAPGGSITPHIHPTEEAMFVTLGTLEAVLGDESCTVKAGDAVLAPVGVKHGFVNRSSEHARLVFVFPTSEIVMQEVG